MTMPVSVPPKRIVVAVDFGAASEVAVTLAGRIASHFGASLLAVHAETVEVPPYFTRDQMDRLDQEVRAARHRAEAEVRTSSRPTRRSLSTYAWSNSLPPKPSSTQHRQPTSW
jgi:K+-sensing histidine kinase KdpD